MRRLIPSLVTARGYGIIYAISPDTGVVLPAAIGGLVFLRTLDAPAMIVVCVFVINLFSKSVSHQAKGAL